MKYYLLISWFIFIFSVGIQFIHKEEIKTNVAFVFDEDISDITIPIDGWLATLFHSFIPIFRVILVIFTLVMAYSKPNSDFLYELRFANRNFRR